MEQVRQLITPAILECGDLQLTTSPNPHPRAHKHHNSLVE